MLVVGEAVISEDRRFVTEHAVVAMLDGDRMRDLWVAMIPGRVDSVMVGVEDEHGQRWLFGRVQVHGRTEEEDVKHVFQAVVGRDSLDQLRGLEVLALGSAEREHGLAGHHQYHWARDKAPGPERATELFAEIIADHGFDLRMIQQEVQLDDEA
jgi:hypothetical protein